MCNRYRYNLPLERLVEDFSSIKIPLTFPTGRPNLAPTDYAITDRAPIVRATPEGARLDMMRWSWPQGPRGAPLFNFRSEGRRFATEQRCLIPTDGFYEFTAAESGAKGKKDRWLFTLPDMGIFAIAGIWKPAMAKGEDAWTMLTVDPGPDIAPIHDRQVVVLARDDWDGWLSGGREEALLRPTPGGTLEVVRDKLG